MEITEKKVSDILNMHDIQVNDPASKTCEYMRGMANALILVKTILNDEHEPVLLESPQKEQFYHMNGMSADFDIDAELGQLVLAMDKALDFVVNGPGVLASQKIINEQFEAKVVNLIPRVKVVIENRITVKYPYSKLVDMTFENRNGLPLKVGGYSAMDRLKSSINQLHSPACQLSIMMANAKVERDIDVKGLVDELARLNEHIQQITLLFGITRDDIELASRQRMDKVLA